MCSASLDVKFIDSLHECHAHEVRPRPVQLKGVSAALQFIVLFCFVIIKKIVKRRKVGVTRRSNANGGI